MSGEYNTTVTGSTSAELNFTPEVKSFKVRGTHASDLLAKAAHDAMTLERTTAELAAVRAQLEETESERDRLLEVQDNVAVVAEVVTVAEADSVLPEPLVLEDGAEVILVREDDAQVEEVVAREVEAELAAPQTILISTMPPVLPSVTEQAPSASKTEDQPVKTPTEATERKLTRAEIFELSRRNQALVLRTILEHENCDTNGRLEGKNIGGEIKKRTGLNRAEWKNAFSNSLSGKSWFTTEHQPDNPKRTAVIIIDLTGLADAIDIGDLPLLVPGDAELTQKLLKRAKPDPHPDEADIPVLPQSQASAPELDATTITPNASSAQEVSVPQAAEKPRAPAPSPQPQVASLPRSTPPPLPKSGRQRRQEEYDRREHQVQAALVESASPPTGPATRRSFAEEPLGDGEIVLPVYLEISEEIWQAIEDDDVRFLLALLNHTVKKGASSTNELLNAVVKAGRIDLNGDNGVHDPKKLPSIIKGLKNISRPKIVFDGNGGKPTITLTKEGEAYLATQYRKIQQKLHRTKEGPKVTSRARTKAA